MSAYYVYTVSKTLHITMAISEWTDQNLAEVIIIGGMVFCALSVSFTLFSFILSESLLFALEGRARRIF